LSKYSFLCNFRVVFENEVLGNYSTAEQAAQDLAGRQRFLVAGGFDTAKLRVPESLARWENCLLVPV